MSVYERVLLSCPYCGQPAPPPAQRSSPEQVDGDLAELDVAALHALAGAIARVDGAAPFLPGANAKTNGAINRTHWARQQAQGRLRPAMALWGGWQARLGRSEREAQRRFFLRYGIDVLSAQALVAAEADELLAKIEADLAREGVRAA